MISFKTILMVITLVLFIKYGNTDKNISTAIMDEKRKNECNGDLQNFSDGVLGENPSKSYVVKGLIFVLNENMLGNSIFKMIYVNHIYKKLITDGVQLPEQYCNEIYLQNLKNGQNKDNAIKECNNQFENNIVAGEFIEIKGNKTIPLNMLNMKLQRLVYYAVFQVSPENLKGEAPKAYMSYLADTIKLKELILKSTVFCGVIRCSIDKCKQLYILKTNINEGQSDKAYFGQYNILPEIEETVPPYSILMYYQK